MHSIDDLAIPVPGSGGQPDFTQPILVPDIHAANLYFQWVQQTVGFGECHLSLNADGSVTADTEGMGRDWLRRALHAAADLLADAAVVR